MHKGAGNYLATTLTPSNPFEFPLGDIFDIKKCKRADVHRMIQLRAHYARLYGQRWLDGNHEVTEAKDRVICITMDIGYCHGDFISWGKEKSEKYRAKKPGTSIAGRMVTELIEAAEHGYDRKLEREDLERAFMMCVESGVKILIMGHLHPKTMRVYYHKDIMLICLPRGKTIIKTAKLFEMYSLRN